MADEEERFAELVRYTAKAHVIVRMMLAELPIPVRVPEFPEPDADADDILPALTALDRARALISDEPLPLELCSAYRNLILEWLNAYEIVTLVQQAGPVSWRLDILTFTLHRIAVIVTMIEGGELLE
ncbi:hypothetical protein [Wenjunlia vitaminophila]|uniref:hypothetical protein n=1 Tax=Wenjunlia vitaminophila TaxID=76728 RepID=UPI000377E4FC|nr:hypothetical protein [Wenjunlia vitaminophila]